MLLHLDPSHAQIQLSAEVRRIVKIGIQSQGLYRILYIRLLESRLSVQSQTEAILSINLLLLTILSINLLLLI